MEWAIKDWSELSKDEIEKIFSLRSEVFIVEQDCVYQDIDGKDKLAKHVFGFEKAAEAHLMMQQAQHHGKLLLSPSL